MENGETLSMKMQASASVSPHAPKTPDENAAKLMRRATWASVSVSSTLVVAKAAAFFLTGSIAVLAALVDSAIDLVASLGNLFAVRQALMPADKQHRFGHGKAEPLASLGQAVFITGSAAFLIFEAIRHLIVPRPLTNGAVAIGVMVFSILASLALITFQRRVVQRTASLAIAGDREHYRADLLTNAGVIVALVLSSEFGWYVADPLIGLGIACVLGVSAWRLFQRSFDQLMDHELPEKERERIWTIVLAHRRVQGLHDLRTRASGTALFIQFHIEMDPALSLVQAHDVSDEVEGALLKAFPRAEIIIHQDPQGAEQPPPLALS